MYVQSFGSMHFAIPVLMEDTGAATVSGYNTKRPVIMPATMADGMKDRPGRVATNPATLDDANYGLGKSVLTQAFTFTWTPVGAVNASSVSSPITSPATVCSSYTRQYGFKFDSVQTRGRDSSFQYGDDVLDFLSSADENSWGNLNNWQGTGVVSSFKFDIGKVGKAMYSAGYMSGRALVFFTFCGLAYGTGSYKPADLNGHMRLLKTTINSGPGGATVDCKALGFDGQSVSDYGFGTWFADTTDDKSCHFCFHALVDYFTILDAYNLASTRSWTSEFVPCSTCDSQPSYGLPKFPSMMVSVVAEDYT